MNWKAFSANRKTTVADAIGAVGFILTALQLAMKSEAGFDFWAFIQSDGVLVAITAVIGGIGFALSGLFSRDADKSSQDSEIRNPAPDASALEAKIEEKVMAQVNEAIAEAVKR